MVPTFWIAYGGFDNKTNNNKKGLAFGFPSGKRNNVKVEKGDVSNGSEN